MIDPIEKAELEAMRNQMLLTVKDALIKIQRRIMDGQFDLAKDYMAQAEIVVQALEDN